MLSDSKPSILRATIRLGLLGGGVSLALSLIGMVVLFDQRDMIAGIFTLGLLIFFLPAAITAYLGADKVSGKELGRALPLGVLTGLFASVPLVILILLANSFDLRQFLPNVSPALLEFLAFGQGSSSGLLILAGLMGFSGLIGAGLYMVPDPYQRPLLLAIGWTLFLALLSEVLLERVRAFFGQGVANLVFEGRALRVVFALILFAVAFGFTYWRNERGFGIQQRIDHMPSNRQRTARWIGVGLIILFLLLLPLLLGSYLSEVLDNVGIFILMGLGLTIVVGFAGLLDLGYVAFFAIGAYTMAILTSQGALGFGGLSFWAALPIAVLMAALAGIVLGIPVLRMRGDYLAIVTLGFGEIIRILALSDFLKPYIGGAQGVLQIPKPEVAGFSLIQPNHIYYVILFGALIVAFIARRLGSARIGRQWMSLREDEDVSEAMGIKLVNIKLLAFAFGAAFGGLAGAIFASKLTSIFPHSFSLLISINVLSLIILGGLGSFPGVVIGAIVLVGLPELLREFKEFRLLMYGAVLIGMMLLKPEGLWPSKVRRRELRGEEDVGVTAEMEAAEAAD